MRYTCAGIMHLGGESQAVGLHKWGPVARKTDQIWGYLSHNWADISVNCPLWLENARTLHAHTHARAHAHTQVKAKCYKWKFHFYLIFQCVNPIVLYPKKWSVTKKWLNKHFTVLLTSSLVILVCLKTQLFFHWTSMLSTSVCQTNKNGVRFCMRMVKLQTSKILTLHSWTKLPNWFIW